MFTLAISCLTTSSLPCLIHGPNIPGSYAILFFAASDFTSPVTSTAGCCFRFGSISSLFLELFLHCSPVAYWAPTNLFHIYRKVNKLVQWTTLCLLPRFHACWHFALFASPPHIYIYICIYICIQIYVHIYVLFLLYIYIDKFTYRYKIYFVLFLP